MPPKTKKKSPAALKKAMREIVDLDLEREEHERVAAEKKAAEETEKKATGNYDYLLWIYSNTKLLLIDFFFTLLRISQNLILLYFTFKIEKKNAEKKERPRKAKSQASVALSPEASDCEEYQEDEAEAEESEEEAEEDVELGSEEEFDEEEDDEIRIVEKPPPKKIFAKKVKKTVIKRAGTPTGPKPAKASAKIGKVISLFDDLSLTADGCGIGGCEHGMCKAILTTLTIPRGAIFNLEKTDIRTMIYQFQGKGVVKRKRDPPPPQADDDDVEEYDEDVDGSDGHEDEREPTSKKKKTSKKNYMFTLPDTADMDISANENINRPTTICVGSGFYVSAAQIKGKAGTRDFSYPAICFTKKSGDKATDKEYTINVNFRLTPKIIDALTTLHARSLW
jgi:hypothetical protein